MKLSGSVVGPVSSRSTGISPVRSVGSGGGGGGSSPYAPTYAPPPASSYMPSHGAGGFTMPAQRYGSPTCPPGYSTIVKRGSGGNYAVCTPLPRKATPPPPPPGPPIIAPVITVSPSMQQQFTPQFAPTMQQQQDSPGAAQATTPTQVASPAQRAVSKPPTVIIPSSAPSDFSPMPGSAPAGGPGIREDFETLLDFFRSGIPELPDAIPMPTIPGIPATTPAYYPGPITVGPRAATSEIEREKEQGRGPEYGIAKESTNMLPLIIGGGLLLMLS